MRKKNIRNRGKLQLSRYFQELKQGDSVAVIKEQAVSSNFPERLQGRTGTIKGEKGKAYVVKIKDQKKEKEFIINPIHLKKIKQNNIKENDKK